MLTNCFRQWPQDNYSTHTCSRFHALLYVNKIFWELQLHICDVTMILSSNKRVVIFDLRLSAKYFEDFNTLSRYFIYDFRKLILLWILLLRWAMWTTGVFLFKQLSYEWKTFDQCIPYLRGCCCNHNWNTTTVEITTVAEKLFHH